MKATHFWKNPRQTVSIQEVSRAAFLAKHGYLTEVKWMNLVSLNGRKKDAMDINIVPAGDLAKLSSCVSDGVVVTFVQGDLSIVFRNIKCQWLKLSNHSVHSVLSWTLTQDDTQSLVAAMVSGVQKVELFRVRLDMELLARYDGKGKCDSVKFFRMEETKWILKFETLVKAWAQRMEWKYTKSTQYCSAEDGYIPCIEISREAAPKKGHKNED